GVRDTPGAVRRGIRAAPCTDRSAGATCREAELGDREEELPTLAELALLIGPELPFLPAHPPLLDDIVLEQRHERATVGIGDQLGRCEGVRIHLDAFEA